VQGNLYQTRNVSLDEDGIIKLAEASVTVQDEADDVDFDLLHSMFHGKEVYVVGGDLFRNAPIGVNSQFTNATTVDTTPPSPGAENDGVFFNNTEVVSDGGTIKYNTAGTWTTISGTPTGVIGNPTALEIFPNQNSLLVGRGNRVARVNSSWAVAVTLELPTGYIVTSIATNGAYAYIATRHKENGEALMFLWTGINATNDGAYGVGTYGIQSVRKYQSSVVLMDSLGRLLHFNGSGFTELAGLPTYYQRVTWGDANNDYSNIYNRGMVIDGDLIYINIATETQDSNYRILPNQIGNIWCYDPKVGLYQKYSFSNTEVLTGEVTTANINTTDNILTVTGATVPHTGSLVYRNASSTLIENVVDNVYYYVIKLTDSTMKLAESYRNAMANVPIDLGTITGTLASDYYFISQKDYGQGMESNSGALLILNNNEYSETQLNRVCFTGETYSNTMGLVWRYMQLIKPLRNLGYIVTPKMFADNTQDQFASVTLRFKPLDYGDKITIKYRTEDRLRFPVMPNSPVRSDNYISWSSATTFTTPATPQDNYYDMSTVVVGDEVEIIAGSGSGFLAHISSISRSGLQYTVTLDTANPFYQASDVSMIKVDNWKTLEVIDGTTFTGTQKTIAVDASGGWVQFKVVMEGVGVALYDTFITNKAFEKAR